MFDAQWSLNDVGLMIGNDRDPNAALQRLNEAGILRVEIDQNEVLKIVEDEFGHESALRKMNKERRREADELFEQLKKQSSVTKEEKSRYHRLRAPIEMNPPTQVRLANDLRPYLSENGQKLSQSYFGESLQSPACSTELKVEDLMASESAKIFDVRDEGVLRRPRFYRISQKWVPNKVLGAQMKVDDGVSPHITEGGVGIILEYGFVHGIRIYRTGIETVMKCPADWNLQGKSSENSSEVWPRSVFNGVTLHPSQADAYYTY